MSAESHKTFCYKHPNRETRLKCTECEKYICSGCAIQAPVGQKCPDCVASKMTHLEKITTPQLLKAAIVAIITASVIGYFWADYNYGFIGLILAYLIGYCVCWSIKKAIGVKIGMRVHIIASVAVIIGILYNPIILLMEYVSNGNSLTMVIVYIKQPFYDFMSLFNGNLTFLWVLVSIGIAIWATTIHLKLFR